MSQPPSGHLPPWERPQWQAGGSDHRAGSGQQSAGAPDHQQAQGQQPHHGGSPYGQLHYGQAPQYGASQQYGPASGQLPYGQVAYPYAVAPRRNTQKVLLWCLAGGVALLLLVVGTVLVLASTSESGSTTPAPAATREPTGLGDDPEMDRLAQQCHDGSMVACDDLYTWSDAGSDYEDYGDTCAGRREGGVWEMCTDVFSDTAGSIPD